MPQITNVRIMRFRKVQPEQFGGAGAEVELHATVLEGEDYRDVSRGLLFDARAMVYENLGMKLPKSAFDTEAELAKLEKASPKPKPKPEAKAEKAEVKAEKAEVKAEKAEVKAETAASEVPGEDVASEGDAGSAKEPAKKKGRGRPKGSKNKKKSDEGSATEPANEGATEGASEIPGEEAELPQVSTNPEDRKDPDDSEVPGEEAGEEDDGQIADATALNKYINSAIQGGNLTGVQGKEMLKAMSVARVRDIDTPEKIAQAKMLIDTFISQNSKGS